MRGRVGFALLLGLLSACATAPKAEPETRYKIAKAAVAVGCVVDRPAPPMPLNQRITPEEWEARAPGAHAESFKAQAGERMNYEDRLEAATSGCKDAPKQENDHVD